MIGNFANLILDELTPGSDILNVPAWIALVFAATMAVFLIHLIIYMLAKAFDIADLKAYSESEMMQALATFLMAGFIVVMLSSAADFAYKEFLSGGQIPCGDNMLYITGPTSFGADGLDVIQCRLLEKATAMSELKTQILNSAAGSGIFDQLNDRVSLMGASVSQGDWDSKTYSTAEGYRYANIFATTLLASLNAQAFFVMYIKKNMISFFLPMGIILRGFNFTRAIGAFFIALAIGLYFILPILYLITDPGFVRVPPTASAITTATYCYQTFSGAINLVGLPKVQAIGEEQTAMDMTSISSELSSTYMSLLTHAFVVLSITLVLVRYGMTLLGGETMELMRLVGRVV